MKHCFQVCSPQQNGGRIISLHNHDLMACAGLSPHMSLSVNLGVFSLQGWDGLGVERMVKRGSCCGSQQNQKGGYAKKSFVIW